MADGKVDGTSFNDSISSSYSDGDGDSIDGGDGWNDSVYGYGGSDTIDTGSGDDTVYGGSGDDTIYGGSGGNDWLYGGSGNDSFWGSSGNDVIYGGTGQDTLEGDSGDDTLYSDSGDDDVYGGRGNDRIIVTSGTSAYIEGNSGDDTLDFSGLTDTYISGYGFYSGSDGYITFYNGERLEFRGIENFANYSNKIVAGGSGSENMGNGYTDGEGDAIGSADGNENDKIHAGAGNDTVTAGTGDDAVYGSNDGDWVYGGTGDDSLEGGAGSDNVYGGSGADYLGGGWNNDSLYGGAGSDTMIADHGSDYMAGGSGDDIMRGGYETPDFGGSSDRMGPGDDLYIGQALYSSNNDARLIVRMDGSIVVQIDNDGNGTLEVYNVFGHTVLGAERLHVGTDGNLIAYDKDGNILASTGSSSGSPGELVMQTDGNLVYYDESDSAFWALGTSGNNNSFSVAEGSSNDTMDGGAGADTIYGEGGADSLTGGSGDDVIYGGTANDSISGAAGADSLDSGSGDDTVSGGTGNDTIATYSGNDTIYGNSGDDSLFAGSGNDSIQSGAGNDTALGGAGTDYVYGNAGDDALYGGAGTDTLYGDSGDDALDGGSGDDQLYGGDGADTLYSGPGNDTYAGGTGMDYIDFGNETSAVSLNLATNTLGGAATGDVIWSGIDGAYGTDYDDTLVGFDGFSLSGDAYTNIFYGRAGNDDLAGLQGPDELYGGSGEDTIRIADNAGNDTIEGGEGGSDTDVLDLTAVTSAVTVTYSGPEAGTVTFGTNTITFSEIERIDLTAQADSVTAGASDDVIYGYAGDDVVVAGAGSDTVFGGAGNDSITSGSGDDSLSGGSGDDTFYITGPGNHSVAGGETSGDNDILDLSAVSGDAYVFFASGDDGAGTVKFSNGDIMIFSEMESVVGGNRPDGTVTGTAGDDVMTGGYIDSQGDAVEDWDYALADSIVAGQGADTVEGGQAGDTIYGGSGADVLSGNSGDDSVFGEAGADVIDGGTGSDTLFGGSGDDTFIMDDGYGTDTIYGGEAGSDNDVLDLTRFDTTGATITYTSAESGTVTHGSDTITFYGIEEVAATDQADTLSGSSAGDSMAGGAGNDQIDGNSGDDSLYGGSGDDLLIIDENDSVIDGGTGRDTVSAADAGSGISFDMGASNVEEVWGSDFGDTIDGSSAASGSSIQGGGGADVLSAGGGQEVYGGSGDDSISSAGGDDTLYGGSGSDYITLTGPGNYQLFGGEDAGDTDNDTLDLSALGDSNQVSSITYGGGDNESGTIVFTSGDTATFSGFENVICFARGTHILTANGYRPVERLRAGDMVRTKDRGMRPLRWIGSRTVSAMGSSAPVVIGEGVLGNRRELVVSPQHRMLVAGWQADVLFGEPEVFVPAKFLIDYDNTYRRYGGEVEYFHLCFDRHEVIFAEGAACESFLPGAVGADAIPDHHLAELYQVFPQLRDDIHWMKPARLTLRAHEARSLRRVFAQPSAEALAPRLV